MVISTAEKILIAGGMLNLAYGAILGYPITIIRAKGAPVTPKYLMSAHVATLQHAAILFGLVWAAELSTLGSAVENTAAWLFVSGSALIATKDTLSWLKGVKDDFTEKPRFAAPLGALSGIAETASVGIFLAGVLMAL